jgi:hypothetical protein
VTNAALGGEASFQTYLLSVGSAVAGALLAGSPEAAQGEAPQVQERGPAVQSGPTASGPSAPCDTAGHPACGKVPDRLRSITPLERAADALAYLWRYTPIPDAPGDGRARPAVIDRDYEYTAGIVVDRNGIPRLTKTFTDGTPQRAQLDWSKVKLNAGDTVVGTVHNHPIPRAERLHFSEGDIKTADDFLRDNRGIVNARTGGNFYVVSPGQSLVYEIGGRITPLGF